MLPKSPLWALCLLGAITGSLANNSTSNGNVAGILPDNSTISIAGLLTQGAEDTPPEINTDTNLCEITPAGAARKIRALVEETPALFSRATDPQPLVGPDAAGGASAQQNFMRTQINAASSVVLGIYPDREQTDNWKIPLRFSSRSTISTPVGVTGLFHAFGNTKTTWKMTGMTGCSAMFIVSEHGFWAGHFWEGSSEVNGASSHNYRVSDTEVQIRSPSHFQQIAADILTVDAPAAAVNFQSPSNIAGNPWANGADVYILTKATGPAGNLKYTAHIEKLKLAVKSFIPAADFTVRTYIGDTTKLASTFPADLNGVSLVQYTPFEGYDGQGTEACNRQARVRIFEEINGTPVIDKPWTPAGNQVLNKRDNAACKLPTPTPKPTPAPAPVALPCYMFEDPDQGQGAKCTCSNGGSAPPVTKTDAKNTALGCPWTTLPPEALTTAAPPPKDKQQYAYTYTDFSSNVYECESSSLELEYGPYPLTQCAGSSALLYRPPLATMELGQSKVNVGSSMTGEQLYTSISNAIVAQCPTPTSSGAWTSCQTGTIKVGPATYLEDKAPKEGDLTVQITDAQYNSSDYLDLFINMIARSANASATGDNCALLDWVTESHPDISKRSVKFNGNGKRGDPPPDEITYTNKGASTFCNMNGFLDTQFYDGVQEAAQMWLEAEFGFELGELGNFDCASTVDAVGEVLGLIFDAVFPEFSPFINAGLALGELACEAAETFNKAGHRREIDAVDAADSKLAKAWEKEMKKDRKLPIPEHKKRELGMLD